MKRTLLCVAFGVAATLPFISCTTTTNSTLSGPAIWDIETIDAKVERIAAGEHIEFYDRLLSQADLILEQTTNPTVVDKPGTPASGDKHDYMSLSRYWWPNPDTADGLPYIRKDGLSNPELREYDRPRLSAMSESVRTLSLVYYISGEQKYADKAISRLRTWFTDPETRVNPNLNFAQIRKVTGNDYGSQFGLLDGLSYVGMLDAVSLIELRGAMPSGLHDSLQMWFADYSEWMLTSKNGIAEGNGDNNHAVAYDMQVIRYAMYGGRDSVARAVIEAFPERRMATQITEDGRMPEELARATAYFYTRYNIEHMVDICDMAEKLGIDLYPACNRAIERAIDWMIPHSVDQSTFPYQQIHGWERARESFARLLYRASKYGKEEEYKAYYREHCAEQEDPMFEFIYL